VADQHPLRVRPFLAGLLRDPRLPHRRELEAARAWAVPRSIFLGRPQPAPGEALWTDEDRAWALALLQVEAEVCGGCHQQLSESTDEALEEAWQAEVVLCHACATAGRHAERWRKENGDGPAHGAGVRVTRRKEAAPWLIAPSTSG
jgi:hypothetical protein